MTEGLDERPKPSARASYEREQIELSANGRIVCGTLSLGDLRVAVSGNHEELHGPLGSQRPESPFATRIRVERDSVRTSGYNFSIRVCGRNGFYGPADRPARHAHRLYGSDGFLERRFDDARGGGLISFVRDRTGSVGIRRSGRFSGEREEHRGVVSEKRAGAGDGHLQRRNERRWDDHTVAGVLDHGALGLALGIFDYGNARICVADALADDLQK